MPITVFTINYALASFRFSKLVNDDDT